MDPKEVAKTFMIILNRKKIFGPRGLYKINSALLGLNQ